VEGLTRSTDSTWVHRRGGRREAIKEKVKKRKTYKNLKKRGGSNIWQQRVRDTVATGQYDMEGLRGPKA